MMEKKSAPSSTMPTNLPLLPEVCQAFVGLAVLDDAHGLEELFCLDVS